MLGDLPFKGWALGDLTPALGTVIGAMIAAAVALVGLIISKEQKTSGEVTYSRMLVMDGTPKKYIIHGARR